MYDLYTVAAHEIAYSTKHVMIGVVSNVARRAVEILLDSSWNLSILYADAISLRFRDRYAHH